MKEIMHMLPKILISMTSIIMAQHIQAIEPRELKNQKILNLKTVQLKQQNIIENFAIASWRDDPNAIKTVYSKSRPVVVLTPGWEHPGTHDKQITSPHTLLLAKEFYDKDYVVLEVGFKMKETAWNSNINDNVSSALKSLCNNKAIPANCAAIVLVPTSYSAQQVSETLRVLRDEQGFNTQQRKILGVVTQHSGYQWTLIDTHRHSVAMIQSSKDNTFSNKQSGAIDKARQHGLNAKNVYSWCPEYGVSHTARGPDNGKEWNHWVLAVTDKIIRDRNSAAVPAIAPVSYRMNFTNQCATLTPPPGS